MKALLWLVPQTILNLSMWKKLLVLVFLTCTALAFPLYLSLQSNREAAAMCRREMEGVAYITRIYPLLELIPRHRDMVNQILRGNPAVEPQLAPVIDNIEAAFHRWAAMEVHPGGGRRAGAELDGILDGWRLLKTSWTAADASVSFTNHMALLEKIREFLRDAADRSHLFLDQHPDSRYLIDTLVTQLPEALDVIGVMRGEGAGVAATGLITVEEEIWLSFVANRILRSRNQIRRSLEGACAANAELLPALGTLLPRMEKASAMFLSSADRDLFEAEPITVKSTVFFDRGSEALDVFFEIEEKTAVALAGLLEARLLRLEKARHELLLGTLIPLALLLLFAAMSMLAVGLQNREVKRGLGRFNGGDGAGRVTVLGRDELGRMADQLNQLMNRCSMPPESEPEEVARLRAAGALLEPMPPRLRQIAHHADRAALLLGRIYQELNADRAVVIGEQAGHGPLGDRVREAAEHAEQLRAASEEMSQVVQTMEDIADRTSILGLNASIQAATAGPAGRGFAVIAEEVERLGRRTGEAAEALTRLVTTGLRKTLSMEEALVEMGRDRERAQEVGNWARGLLDEFETTFPKLKELCQTISQGLGQQAQQTDQCLREMAGTPGSDAAVLPPTGPRSQTPVGVPSGAEPPNVPVENETQAPSLPGEQDHE